MKYILLSLILLVGLPDVTFGQSKWDKFLKKVEKASKEAQKIDKQVQQLKKQAEKSGRKQSPVKVPHFKNISKADFISGKYKKITIPYDQSLSVKYGVAEWEVTREGKKQYQISNKIYMTADEATYDRWRKRLKL
jgi:predicted  nucleic acid-binding Zn-ribbon protein